MGALVDFGGDRWHRERHSNCRTISPFVHSIHSKNLSTSGLPYPQPQEHIIYSETLVNKFLRE